MNYFDTLIAVADDCPVTRSLVPTDRGGKPTVAVIQYGMISADPYARTQEDVLFETWLQRQEPPLPEKAFAQAREAFFSKPQACLRSSPLPKKYGFGLLFDRSGRVALCPMESEEYQRIVGGQAEGVRVLKALRSKRVRETPVPP